MEMAVGDSPLLRRHEPDPPHHHPFKFLKRGIEMQSALRVKQAPPDGNSLLRGIWQFEQFGCPVGASNLVLESGQEVRSPSPVVS
jgi:hypothetical protein